MARKPSSPGAGGARPNNAPVRPVPVVGTAISAKDLANKIKQQLQQGATVIVNTSSDKGK
jgi:hypothetical protein